MQRRTALQALLLAAAALATGGCERRSRLSPWEYEIYGAFLAQAARAGGPGHAPCLEAEARLYVSRLRFEELWRSRAPDDLIPPLLTANEYRAPLQPRSVLGPATTIGRPEQLELFRPGGGGWPEFYRRRPDADGIWTLSRIARSADHRRALLIWWKQRDGRNGQGGIALLERPRERWQLVIEEPLWRS